MPLCLAAYEQLFVSGFWKANLSNAFISAEKDANKELLLGVGYLAVLLLWSTQRPLHLCIDLLFEWFLIFLAGTLPKLKVLGTRLIYWLFHGGFCRVRLHRRQFSGSYAMGVALCGLALTRNQLTVFDLLFIETLLRPFSFAFIDNFKVYFCYNFVRLLILNSRWKFKSYF